MTNAPQAPITSCSAVWAVSIAPTDAARTRSVHVLLISGSLRSRSTNTSVLRTARIVAPRKVVATVYEGLARLPQFNPDNDVDRFPPAVASLRNQIRTAYLLLFSTPEYAGALPGAFKNMLDWMIGDDEVGSIYEKPVVWINASPRGAPEAHESLRRCAWLCRRGRSRSGMRGSPGDGPDDRRRRPHSSHRDPPGDRRCPG